MSSVRRSADNPAPRSALRSSSKARSAAEQPRQARYSRHSSSPLDTSAPGEGAAMRPVRAREAEAGPAYDVSTESCSALRSRSRGLFGAAAPWAVASARRGGGLGGFGAACALCPGPAGASGRPLEARCWPAAPTGAAPPAPTPPAPPPRASPRGACAAACPSPSRSPRRSPRRERKTQPSPGDQARPRLKHARGGPSRGLPQTRKPATCALSLCFPCQGCQRLRFARCTRWRWCGSSTA